jgi:hypothetical protein
MLSPMRINLRSKQTSTDKWMLLFPSIGGKPYYYEVSVAKLIVGSKFLEIWGRSVSIETRLRAGLPRFDSWEGQGIFLFPARSRPALGPTQLPIQWIKEVISPGVKRPLLVPKLRMRGATPQPLPPPPHRYIFIAWCLVEHSKFLVLCS